MNWFGESWGAPVCDPDTHVDTPVGAECGWCEESVADDDSGVSLPYATKPMQVINYHLNCWLRQIFGSLGHQAGECVCHKDVRHSEPGDPPEMTLREAADAAVEAFYERNSDARQV